MKFRIVVAAFCVLLAGCASMRPTVKTEAAYVIYDVKPATIDRNQFLDSVTTAVKKYVGDVHVSRGIPPVTMPENPGRFELQNAFKNSGLGALMAANSQSLKLPSCDDSIMTVASTAKSMREYGENTYFFLCVYPYTAGYQIDVYSRFTSRSGGFSPKALGATLGRKLVGDSSQMIPRAMNQVRIAAEDAGGTVTVVSKYVPDEWKGAFVHQEVVAQEE